MWSVMVIVLDGPTENLAHFAQALPDALGAEAKAGGGFRMAELWISVAELEDSPGRGRAARQCRRRTDQGLPVDESLLGPDLARGPLDLRNRQPGAASQALAALVVLGQEQGLGYRQAGQLYLA